MNLIKLQDTKLMQFYTLITKDQKEKLREQFTIETKRIKLLKEAKDLYSENYETLLKVIKDDTNREIYHVLG